MKESEIERADRKRIAQEGGLLLKFVSPNRIGVADNILLNPVPEEYRELVGRFFRFVEYKRPNTVPRPSQVREHERMRAMGFFVDVIDSKPKKETK